MVEGIAAVAVVFILFSVLVQASVLMIAAQAAESAAASAARRTAMGEPQAEDRFGDDLEATVPGMSSYETALWRRDGIAHAWARLRILPPGPVFRSLAFVVEAEVPVVAEP